MLDGGVRPPARRTPRTRLRPCAVVDRRREPPLAEPGRAPPGRGCSRWIGAARRPRGAARRRRTQRDDGYEQPDRSTAHDQDPFAVDGARPAYVVDGHGRRFDERGVTQAGPSGRRTRIEAGTVHRLCMEPGESIPTKTNRWQTCWWPARQAGHSPHHRSGMTVTGSPTAQPATPGPTSATRPDTRDRSLRASGPDGPSRRAGCAGQSRRCRCTRHPPGRVLVQEPAGPRRQP